MCGQAFSTGVIVNIIVMLSFKCDIFFLNLFPLTWLRQLHRCKEIKKKKRQRKKSKSQEFQNVWRVRGDKIILICEIHHKHATVACKRQRMGWWFVIVANLCSVDVFNESWIHLKGELFRCYKNSCSRPKPSLMMEVLSLSSKLCWTWRNSCHEKL